jgi:hypothetical protein
MTGAAVMRGLDPRIHHSSKDFIETDGLPVKPGNDECAVTPLSPARHTRCP